MFRNAVNGPPPTLPSNTPLSGRTCIVTGANRGIGFECAKHLAALGASRVVLAVRDTAAGEKAKESILATLENRDSVRVEVRKLDLASFASVRAFVDEWSKQTSEADRNVHLLVENAGIQPGSSLKTEDGYELTLQTNHLSHFLLTLLLLSFMPSSSRIVIVGSRMHLYGPITAAGTKVDWGSRNWDQAKWSSNAAYCDSKTANVLFTNELDRRLAKAGKEISVACVHPGLVSTDFAADVGWMDQTANYIFRSLFGRPPEEGGRVVAYVAAAGPDELGPDGEGEQKMLYFHSDGKRVKESEAGRDPVMAAELWDFSAKAVGLSETI